MPATLDYPVLELQRAALVTGGAAQVALLDTCYLDEPDDAGAIALGQFFERDHADRFAWLRGYRDLEVRAAHGREWVRRAREDVLQRYLLGSHSLLLRPLHPGAQIPTLAPVDLVIEPDGAQGLAVAQLLPVVSGRLDACAAVADPWFARYNGHGMIEAGILRSLDQAAEAWLVWLGVLRDDAALAALAPQCAACADALAAHGLLAGAPELLVLAPAPRSRLRWAPRTIA